MGLETLTRIAAPGPPGPAAYVTLSPRWLIYNLSLYI